LGVIEIKAKHLVYRRYCALEDVLAISMPPTAPGSNPIFNTGGDLVELGELARMVVDLVNPNAEVRRQVDLELPPDNYHSDNKDWESLVGLRLMREDAIREQIARVAGLKT
jgi:hypothetical protein